MSKKAEVAVLLSLVEDTKSTFFQTTLGEAYVSVPKDGHNELYPIKSAHCRDWLGSLYYYKEKQAVGNGAMIDVLSTLEAKAKFGNKENKEPVTLHNRVAKVNDSFWYDLTNATWQAVEITGKGWSVEQSPNLFMRYNHHIAQVTPERGGNVWDIFKYIPLNEEYQLLFLCWLITCYIPDIPHPLTVFYGEQGAAKTTTSEFIKSLIDPSQTETLRLENDMDSLLVNLQQDWFIPFDNVSKISVDVSDALCRSVTGAAVKKRKKYTDGEGYIFKFKRCISINGINNVVLRPDLLDRSLLFHIGRIPKEERKELSKIKEEFAQNKPRILGGIMDTLVKAKTIYPTVKLEQLPRMTDFTIWSYAIAEALGEGKGQQFLDEYEENRGHQNEEAIDADPIASLVLDFMDGRTEAWSGIVSGLHTELSKLALKQNINARSIKFFSQPNQLSRHMNSIKSNLEVAGIQYENHGHGRKGTIITLQKIIDPETPEPPEDTQIHEIINDTAIQVDADIPETPEVTAISEVPKSKKPANAPASSKQHQLEAV